MSISSGESGASGNGSAESGSNRTLKQRICDELARPVPNVLLLQRLRSMRAAANPPQASNRPVGSAIAVS